MQRVTGRGDAAGRGSEAEHPHLKLGVCAGGSSVLGVYAVPRSRGWRQDGGKPSTIRLVGLSHGETVVSAPPTPTGLRGLDRSHDGALGWEDFESPGPTTRRGWERSLEQKAPCGPAGVGHPTHTWADDLTGCPSRVGEAVRLHGTVDVLQIVYYRLPGSQGRVGRRFHPEGIVVHEQLAQVAGGHGDAVHIVYGHGLLSFLKRRVEPYLGLKPGSGIVHYPCGVK